MKKRFILLVGIFLLTVMMGCETKETQTSESSPEPTTKEENNQDKLLELPKSIQDICYGDGEFYDVSRNQTYTKESYQINIMDVKDNSKQKVYWDEYIVTDMDQDGENELIVRLKNTGAMVAARIFDTQQDKVYCYSYNYRSILHIYKDGTILGSSGASNNQWYSLTFEKEKEKRTVIIWEKDIDDCYIKDKKVSIKKFNEFIDKNYSDNQEIPWTDF